ncbi:MAG TPA: hypothetical protein VN829_04335 [Dongiaceae bacterium]|nr:hypothetical protein [Dongiaceae bacterium]
MSEPGKPKDLPLKDQLGTVLHPKNFLKTLASQFPFASAGVEMLNQLEGQRVDKRVTALEQADVQVLSKLQKLEASVVKTPPPAFVEWPAAVSEYLLRSVGFAVVHTPEDQPGHEYILPVANGCLVGDDYVLTCREALEMANNVAAHKRGRVTILFGLCWYEFEAEPVDPATGLVLCKLTKRDEQKWQRARELCKKEGVDLWVEPPIKVVPKWTITPWLGQEVGWIVASDSGNNMRNAQLTHVEFGTAVISHFRMPKETALKVFVTAPYAGRIRQAGSAAFGRDGTLLGIIAEVEKYEYDAGRRAVVKTLLGFPRFTKPKLKPDPAARGMPGAPPA